MRLITGLTLNAKSESSSELGPYTNQKEYTSPSRVSRDFISLTSRLRGVSSLSVRAAGLPQIARSMCGSRNNIQTNESSSYSKMRRFD